MIFMGYFMGCWQVWVITASFFGICGKQYGISRVQGVYLDFANRSAHHNGLPPTSRRTFGTHKSDRGNRIAPSGQQLEIRLLGLLGRCGVHRQEFLLFCHRCIANEIPHPAPRSDATHTCERYKRRRGQMVGDEERNTRYCARRLIFAHAKMAIYK